MKLFMWNDVIIKGVSHTVMAHATTEEEATAKVLEAHTDVTLEMLHANLPWAVSMDMVEAIRMVDGKWAWEGDKPQPIEAEDTAQTVLTVDVARLEVGEGFYEFELDHIIKVRGMGRTVAATGWPAMYVAHSIMLPADAICVRMLVDVDRAMWDDAEWQLTIPAGTTIHVFSSDVYQATGFYHVPF